MQFNIELQGLTIVAIGDFNPAIFQPRWFSSMELIRKDEAESAEVEVIHKQATVFDIEWFRLQVLSDTFTVETIDISREKELRDLVVGTFKILEHTPINAFGLNCHRHYGMPSESHWHAMGNHFAPKDSWKQVLTNPGMRSLAVEGKVENSSAKHCHIKIEPSVKAQNGVYISINEHYELDKNDGAEKRMGKFLEVLQTRWSGFLDFANDTAERLLAEGTKNA